MREEITMLQVEKETLTDSEALLIRETIDGLNERYAKVSEEKIAQDALIKRTQYELNIIINMGFADYLLVVSDFLKVGAALGHMPENRLEYLRSHMAEMTLPEMLDYIKEDLSAPGLTVGLGRGSGAGSVVCYALHITHVEPIQHNLLFERFLNPERVSMPDIDSDFANAKARFGTRDIVIEYVSKKYGHNAICGITTKSTWGMKGALDNIVRVLAGRDTAELRAADKHSEEAERKIKEYKMVEEQIKAMIPADADDFNSPFNDTTVLEMLKAQFANNKLALELLEYAKYLEGINVNYGKHAAGVVIADNGDIGAYGALMHDDEIGWKIQMDGPDVEGIGGLLKMDFLGLTTLNIITATVRMIWENHGVYVDLFNLPEDPKVYDEIFSKGNTFGVFQFASAGAKQILTRFKPSCLEDLILINAINRPGPAQYIDPIIKKKHHQSVEVTAFDKVPCIQQLLAPTYGYPVYQEQVMQIAQEMAGYSLGQADELRRAMSKKKVAVIEENRELFVHGGEMENHDTHKKTPIQGAINRNISESNAYDVYDGIQDFAKYGFNKSHATVYAVTAYMTAWLKYYYPAEFYTANLNEAQTTNTDVADIVADAKNNGMTFELPDINKADIFFNTDGKTICYGYNGFGLKAAMHNEAKDYVSMSDFILRTTLSETTIKTLIEAGSLDRFASSRNAMIKILPTFMELKEQYKTNFNKYNEAVQLLDDMKNKIAIDKTKYPIIFKTRKTMPTMAQVEKMVEDTNAKVTEASTLIRAQVIPVKQAPDDMLERLELEKSHLKAYISGHPLDIYGASEAYDCERIGNITGEIRDCSIMGMITGLRITAKKTDPSAHMAFFTLEDQSGKIPVCVFAKAYEQYGYLLKEGLIIKASGYVKIDKRTEEGTLQFIVSDKTANAVQTLNIAQRPVQAEIAGVEELPALVNSLSVYATEDGHMVNIIDLTTSDVMTLDFKVSDAAIDQKLVH